MSIILALNAGSSSLKYKIYIHQNGHDNSKNKLILLSKGQVTEIGLGNSKNNCQFSAKLYSSSTLEQIDQYSQNIEASTHEIAFTHVLSYLLDKVNHLNKREDIGFIAHRVVHGATEEKPMIISSSSSSLEQALKKLDSLSELAPLHNHTSVLIIRACLNSLPAAKNYIFFDTIFHRTLPKEVYTYALPYEECRSKRIRKYGFHGISHSYVTQRASEYLGVDWKNEEEARFISLHLGSGASVCAVRGGESINTSMGLTPLEGLPGTTRSGTVDPCAIFHLSNLAKSGAESRHPIDRKFHLTEAESILNHKSGFKGICGTSNFAEITKIIKDKGSGNEQFERAKLTFDLFIDRILHFIGAYYVTLEGKVAALLFTGGIGEHSWEIRETICERLKCLGVVELDKKKNQNADKEFT
ncbi:775_t:CDS:2, partial [Ambispora leptoticha]